MARPTSSGRSLPLLALASIVVLLSGCDSGEGVAPSALEGSGSALVLTDHAPDALFAQPGLLRVGSAGRQSWGRGWDRRISTAEDGTPIRWSGGPSSHLTLSALAPSDREIAISVLARVEGESIAVAAHLNGTELGAFTVDEVPTTLRFEAPEGRWVRGENRFELAFDRTLEVWRSQQDGGRGDHAVAVSEVAYAEPRPATWSFDGGLSLAPGASAAYALERGHSAGSMLHVRGRSEGPGELTLGPFGRTGGRCDGREAGDPVRIDVPDGPFDLSLDDRWAASTEGAGDLALRVAWTGEGTVQVERLALEREVAPLPPIVFISIDTLAAANIGTYGYGRSTTPRLDAFAEQCVVFENCRANTSWTAPSYISQFTGLLPAANRVQDAVDGGTPTLWDQRLVAPERWTIAQALRAHGYRTGAVVANTWLALTRGITRGFDDFDDEPSQHPLTDPRGRASVVFERALAWLDADRERPPFVFVQVLDVHAPYLPGEGWRGRFGSDVDGDGPRLPVVGERALVSRSLRRTQTAALGIDGGAVREVDASRMRAAYDENLAEFDADLGAFLDELQQRPWFEEAIVVISADHGEAMEEPRFVFDHFFPDEGVLEVPLIVRLPRAARAGTRIDAPVQLVDLYPTLIEAVGLDPAHRELSGTSLWTLLRGRPSGIGDDRVRFVHDAGNGSRAVVDGRWKLVELPVTGLPVATALSIQEIWDRWAAFDPEIVRRAERAGLRSDSIARLWVDHDDPLAALSGLDPLIASLMEFYAASPAPLHELYDLERDPLALRDVAADHPERVQELVRRLTESRTALEGLRPAAPGADEDSSADDAALERLRALGYLGDE
ncbi:Sulfatase [Planctomycetes bacterium Pla163]|uniref:Sulfatase n=1 Tax=Rohdeia mirabilis TaxID=2528008 RepID=A0A518D367_9BACT|nr:Sulfatase [Planctomycetes bacterium Pla163]